MGEFLAGAAVLAFAVFLYVKLSKKKSGGTGTSGGPSGPPNPDVHKK